MGGESLLTIFFRDDYFEHQLPIHPSSMTRWRKCIGDADAEALLKQTIEAGLKLKAVKQVQLQRVNVDTTVQRIIICAEKIM
jgi:IS5 family transposase